MPADDFEHIIPALRAISDAGRTWGDTRNELWHAARRAWIEAEIAGSPELLALREQLKDPSAPWTPERAALRAEAKDAELTLVEEAKRWSKRRAVHKRLKEAIDVALKRHKRVAHPWYDPAATDVERLRTRVEGRTKVRLARALKQIRPQVLLAARYATALIVPGGRPVVQVVVVPGRRVSPELRGDAVMHKPTGVWKRRTQIWERPALSAGAGPWTLGGQTAGTGDPHKPLLVVTVTEKYAQRVPEQLRVVDGALVLDAVPLARGRWLVRKVRLPHRGRYALAVENVEVTVRRGKVVKVAPA